MADQLKRKIAEAERCLQEKELVLQECQSEHQRVLSLREEKFLQKYSDFVETESKRALHLEGEARAKDAVISKKSSQIAALKAKLEHLKIDYARKLKGHPQVPMSLL